MALANRSMNNPVILEAHEPLAARMARAVVAASVEDLPAGVTDKVKLCLTDLIGCAFESRELPWSRQAVQIAERVDGKGPGAAIAGSAGSFAFGDAAFANARHGTWAGARRHALRQHQPSGHCRAARAAGAGAISPGQWTRLHRGRGGRL
jgi:hypothetical protein